MDIKTMSIGKLVDFLEYQLQHESGRIDNMKTDNDGNLSFIIKDYGWIAVKMTNAGVRLTSEYYGLIEIDISWESFSKVQQERIMTAAHCKPLSEYDQDQLTNMFRLYTWKNEV